MTTNTRDAMWLLFILIIIGVIWNAQKDSGILGIFPGNGPKLEPSDKYATEETIKETRVQRTTTKEIPKTPDISIIATSAKKTNPEEEYIIIKNVSAKKIDVSNLKFVNKNNESETIGNAENGTAILLNPKEQAIISSGKSPISHNFKINKCSGYFNQFNKFIPNISNQCPAIKYLSEANKLDDACFSYLPKIKNCTMPPSLPTSLGSSCQQFIQTHGSYVGCVADYKNDDDFDQGEWRVFFGRTSEFWAQRNETIKIMDSFGKIIAELNY